MHYKEFVEAIHQELEKTFDDTVAVSISKRYILNLGEELEVSMQKKGEKTNLSVFMYQYYRMYLNGSELSEIISDIMEKFQNHTDTDQRIATLIQTMKNYKTTKEHLMFQLINYDWNQGLLKTVPHRKFLDLAIVYHVIPFGCEETETMVTNINLRNWGVSEETLYQDAFHNTITRFVPDILQMENDMYIMTNKKRYAGAASILYQPVIDKMASILGKGYYLVPTSRHEFVIHPEGAFYENRGDMLQFLSGLIQDNNKFSTPRTDQLGDSIYYYDFSKKEISIVSKNY